MLFGAGATAAYTVETALNTHSKPMVMAGPSRDGAMPDGPGGRGPGGAAADNPALENLVRGADNRWAAATVGSMLAGELELKTGASVMAIGGFTGSDNSPTLAQFQTYVVDHQIRYFIPSDRGGPPHRESAGAADIAAWVQQNFTPIDVGGTTVYDLSAPISK
jgi:4-amino-4-deoxy-L-arabinose transferase-like glycosyltransferase